MPRSSPATRRTRGHGWTTRLRCRRPPGSSPWVDHPSSSRTSSPRCGRSSARPRATRAAPASCTPSGPGRTRAALSAPLRPASSTTWTPSAPAPTRTRRRCGGYCGWSGKRTLSTGRRGGTCGCRCSWASTSYAARSGRGSGAASSTLASTRRRPPGWRSSGRCPRWNSTRGGTFTSTRLDARACRSFMIRARTGANCTP
mmetsp:Transcript_128021/g.362356  ORF Transcript_128021/g.362356 Transcript_128021/m.362356 type:complete len:200 (-) Transcript_128021:659-1258(-)